MRGYAARMGSESLLTLLQLMYTRPDGARVRGHLAAGARRGSRLLHPAARDQAHGGRVRGRGRGRGHGPPRRRSRRDAGHRLAAGDGGDAGVAGADAGVWRAVAGSGGHRGSPPHPNPARARPGWGCGGLRPQQTRACLRSPQGGRVERRAYQTALGPSCAGQRRMSKSRRAPRPERERPRCQVPVGTSRGRQTAQDPRCRPCQTAETGIRNSRVVNVPSFGRPKRYL